MKMQIIIFVLQIYEKQHDKSDDWSECLLLENQRGFKLSQSNKSCANHANQKWDKNNLKNVNNNTTNLKLVKKLLLQGLFQYLDVYTLQKSRLFPIGSVLCFNHMKNENKIDKDEPPGIHITQDNPDYETPEPAISENILNSSEAGVTDLSETLDVSPIN